MLSKGSGRGCTQALRAYMLDQEGAFVSLNPPSALGLFPFHLAVWGGREAEFRPRGENRLNQLTRDFTSQGQIEANPVKLGWGRGKPSVRARHNLRPTFRPEPSSFKRILGGKMRVPRVKNLSSLITQKVVAAFDSNMVIGVVGSKFEYEHTSGEVDRGTDSSKPVGI